MRWDQVLEELKNKRYFEQMSPLTIDSLRGTLWGDKYRGSLTEYGTPGTDDRYKLVDKTIKRIQHLFHTELLTQTLSHEPQPYRMGWGTYGWDYNPALVRKAVEGHCLIDTASTYGYGKVEKELAKALYQIDIVAKISTKFPRTQSSFKATMAAGLRASMTFGRFHRLMLSIHWPNEKTMETMRALQTLKDRNRIDEIGVCNFSLDRLIQAQRVPLGALQIRFNPVDRSARRVVIPNCLLRGIPVVGYSTFGQGLKKLLAKDRHQVLSRLSKTYQATPAQIILAWSMSYGVIPLFQTNNLEHLQENMEARDLKLEKSDILAVEESFIEEV